MKQTPDNAGGTALAQMRSSDPSHGSKRDIDGRIFRTMAVAVGLAVVASLTFAEWQITTGLLLGGVLSLLNHYWLITSTTAAFKVVAHGEKPRITLFNYILRYLVVAVVVFAAYKLNLVSLVATIAGLCSFVAALFGEAFREFYFAIIHREEIS
jgi:small-conductance mechanosensitive channel